jgi:hypothetical protein
LAAVPRARACVVLRGASRRCAGSPKTQRRCLDLVIVDLTFVSTFSMRFSMS